MRLIVEEVENGFIVEEDPETMISGQRVLGRRHVFDELDDVLTFMGEFYKNNNSAVAGRRAVAAKKKAP